MLACTLAGSVGAAPESDDLPIAIRDCYTVGASDACMQEQGAHWFFVHGYEHLSLHREASPLLVVRVAEDHTATVLKPGDPAIPERVRERMQAKHRSRCTRVASNVGETDLPCPFEEIVSDDDDAVVDQVLPLGILRFERGHYQVSQPPLDEDEVRRLAPQIKYGIGRGDNVEYLLDLYRKGYLAPVLGPHVRRDSIVYFGLLGGFTEEQGSLGGLAIFDLRAGTWTVQRPRELLEVFATEMIVRENTLWMGTVHYAEGGLIGISGLVGYDLTSGAFRSEARHGVVWMVRGNLPSYTPPKQAALLRSLWLGTDRGLSFFTPESGSWEDWRWQATPAGSDVPYELRYVAKDH